MDQLLVQANLINTLRRSCFRDLLHHMCIHCPDEQFIYYVQVAMWFYLFLLFEAKLLLHGRLKSPEEETRYKDHIVPHKTGSFEEPYVGTDAEKDCKLSAFSADGFQHHGPLKVMNN